MQVAPRYHLLLQPPYLRPSESLQSQESPQPSAEASCRNQVPPAVSPAFKTSSSQPPPQPATLQALSTFKRPALQWCIEITSSNFHLPPLPAAAEKKKKIIGVKEYHHASRWTILLIHYFLLPVLLLMSPLPHHSSPIRHRVNNNNNSTVLHHHRPNKLTTIICRRHSSKVV